MPECMLLDFPSVPKKKSFILKSMLLLFSETTLFSESPVKSCTLQLGDTISTLSYDATPKAMGIPYQHSERPAGSHPAAVLTQEGKKLNSTHVQALATGEISLSSLATAEASDFAVLPSEGSRENAYES